MHNPLSTIKKQEMSLFKNIFSKNNKDEIEEIKGLFEGKDFDSVILKGEKLLKRLKAEERKTIIKLLSLSHFNKGSNKIALTYFKEIASSSTNSDDWFNVTSTAILAKEVDTGMNAFSKAIEFYQKNGTSENIPIGQMSYYVMQAFRDTEEYDLAFVQLMKLRDVYCELKITDPTFLHIRGLPFLSHVMEASKAILKNQKITETQMWLKEFASQLDEEGKSLIEKLANELKK